MNTESTPVSRVYAEALIELAESQGQLDAVAEEAEQLAQLIRDEPGTMRLFAHPTLGREKKQKILHQAFDGKVSDLMFRFLQVVNQKDRLAELPSILSAVQSRMAERRGELKVVVTVAQPLSEDVADRVASGIGSSTGKQVKLEQHVDESLIGGLTVRVGDRLIDASVARQLQKIEQQLITAGRSRAREASVAGAEGPGGQGAE
jgi:F-type H+-transporting ATPase subunit delta